MGSVMNIGFEKVFLMQNGLNLPLSEVISTYVYKIGLMGNNDFSYSTAIGLFNSVINMAMIGIVNWIAGRLSDMSLW
jgi:putative aldouronate transport system permease protein